MKHKKQQKPPKAQQNTVASSPKKQLAAQEHKPWMKWLIPAVLAVITFVVFQPMLKNQFISWDDQDYITENFRIWDLNAENLEHIFTQPMAYNYHPLTMLSLGLNYATSKLDPHAYFLTNLVLHLLNTVLVFWFAYRLSRKNIYVAAFTAAIFAIHPMHVESVAWASERKDVLYTFFFMAGLITWLSYLDTNRKIFYGVTVLLALFSMMSKPAAIIFPFLLIAIEYYRSGKIDARSLVNKIPLLVISAFFIYMTLKAQTHETAVVADFETYNIAQRFLFACFGFMIYLVKFFVPFKLAAFHPYPDPINAAIYLSPLFIIVTLAGIYFFKQHRRLLIFGFLFYAINLVLVLQFVSIGSALYAERYSYVPYIGIAFALGMLLFEKLRLNRNITVAALTIACIAFAVTAHARVKVWENSGALWADMIKKYPGNDKGYYGRADHLFAQEKYEEAIADYGNAIKAGTDFKTYTNRGNAYFKLRRYEEALLDYNESIKRNSLQYEAYVGRAQVNLALNKLEEALQDANTAVSRKPAYEAYYTRAFIYKTMQNYQAAITDYLEAAKYTPDASIYNNLGNVYFQMGDYNNAVANYNKVLSVNPNDAGALSNRGAANFQTGRVDEALPDFIRAAQLEPNNARHYTNLAFVYERKGNKAKALENANAAQKLGVQMDPAFLARIRQ